MLRQCPRCQPYPVHPIVDSVKSITNHVPSCQVVRQADHRTDITRSSDECRRSRPRYDGCLLKHQSDRNIWALRTQERCRTSFPLGSLFHLSLIRYGLIELRLDLSCDPVRDIETTKLANQDVSFEMWIGLSARLGSLRAQDTHFEAWRWSTATHCEQEQEK